MSVSVQSLVLVVAVAAAAPLLANLVSRWIAIPLVVFEIVLGIALGPDGAGWIKHDPYIEFLSTLGLAMLFFLAGYEIDFSRIRGRPLRLSVLGWLLSLVIGVALGIALAPTVAAGVMVGICLTSTALGTLMPVLRDAGELSTPFGSALLAIGAAGEFGPLIAVALFLSGRSPGRASIILIVFAIAIAAALVLTVRFDHVRIHRLIETTLHTSGQFAVRLVILILGALIALASAFGLDVLLGAFAAGVLVSLLLRTSDPAAVSVVEAKLDAVGFGFLVPVFFINTGIGFDLHALLDMPATLVLVPIFLVLFILVRGIPSVLAAPPGSTWRERIAIALLGATGLPIIVAVTAIGVDNNTLRASTAAALIGAGMLSVLLLPLLGLKIRTRQPPAAETRA